ncbi:MAG: TonB-dependent receptor [Bryobacteraceae bacterium]|jgi:hypothetical protein
MRNPLWLRVAALILAAGGAVAAPGGASISGTVVDFAGAPAPRASLTLIHQQSGLRLEVAADQAGNYQATGLPPGPYAVTARSHDEDAIARLNAVVHENEALKLPITLPAGRSTLNSDGLHQLPLETRSYLDLVRAAPGITPGQQGGNIEGYGPYGFRGNSSFNVSGQRGQHNDFTIDGIDNNEMWTQGTVLEPPLDAIESVTLTAGYLPAELGHSAGGAVDVRIRPGQSQFHGAAFDSLGNSALDARNFFDDLGKPGAVRNQFGGSLGGPVHGGNWFFFIDADLLRERQGLTVTSTVPSAAEKVGDFGTVPVYDPLSIAQTSPGVFVRQQFAGNLIPPSRIPSQARNLIGLYPDPNLPGAADNYLYTPDLIRNSDRFDLRSDKLVGSRSALSVRLSYGRLDGQSPSSLPDLAGSDSTQYADGASTGQTTWGGGVSYTFVVRPTLTNELRAGVSSFDLNAVPLDSAVDASAALGIPGLGPAGLPDVMPTGYAQLGAAETLPLAIRTTSYQLEDHVLWTTGRHAWKFGFQSVRRHADGTASEWSSRGTFSFTPDYTDQPGIDGTGNSIASLLLGYPSEVQRDIQVQPFHLRGWEWAGFVQDEVRVLPRLMIEAGVRYSLYPPVTEADNRLVNFNLLRLTPALNQFAGQEGVNEYAGRSYNLHAIAPRIGFALSLSSSGATVLRGGYSTDFDPGAYLAQGSLARNPPFASQQDFFNGSLLVGSSLADGLPPASPVALTTAAALNAAGGAIYAVDTRPFTSDAEQWGLFLQRRLRPALVLEIGGTGCMGAHLYSSYNVNQPDPDWTPFVNRRWAWYSPNVSRIDYLSFAGGSTYYGGQVKITRRSASGVQFQASYTFSKALDDSNAPSSGQSSRPDGPQNINYLRGILSASSFDVTHRLVLSAVYDLPFKGGSRFLRTALANWQASAMVVAQSGFPFTPELAVNGLNNGGFWLPNAIGNGALPAAQRSYLHWFNTSLYPSDPNRAFETPPLYQYGNEGFDTVRGPGMATADVALARGFSIGERLHLQTRVEAYNLLNRANLALPNRILGVDSSGVVSHTATPARQLQLAIRTEW